MIDHFTLLEETRRPWIEVTPLQARFLQLSTASHPDRVHEMPAAERETAHQRYTDLNGAYQCLRHAKSRLAHLLELEQGRKPGGIAGVPPETMDLFIRVGEACRDTDQFLQEKSLVTSPILRVEMFERAMEFSDRLTRLQQTLAAEQAQLEQELKEMNRAWDSAPPAGHPGRAGHLPLSQLERIQQKISYFSRWTEQLHERIARLSF